ncbi:hypothetical protein G7054_g5110 [Neopestalotiopsis clavispora]|nr:hypothetical protein G7054_g5110 [Neopestalotiopsis clavispora]
MIGYCICGVLLSVHEGGQNIWEVHNDQIEPFMKVSYAATIHYAPMALACKLSLLLLIARVFGSVHKKTILGIRVFMGLLVAYYVTAFIIKIRPCYPISAYWKGDMSKCMDQSAVITADSIISVISDLAILLLPTPLTWSLNMPTRKKLRVLGVLCAGGLATAFSILRLGLIIAEGSSGNTTMVFVKVVLTGNAEVGIGIICACLPACNALIIRRNQRYYSEAYSRNAYHRSKGGDNTANLTNRIYVQRDFHLEREDRGHTGGSGSGSGKEIGITAFEMHSDDTQLVTHAQADPGNDAWSNKSV